MWKRARNFFKTAAYAWAHRQAITAPRRLGNGSPAPAAAGPASSSSSSSSSSSPSAPNAFELDPASPFYSVQKLTLAELQRREMAQYTEFLEKSRAEWKAKAAAMAAGVGSDAEVAAQRELHAALDSLDPSQLARDVEQKAREDVVAELLAPENRPALDALREQISASRVDGGVVRNAATNTIVMTEAEFNQLTDGHQVTESTADTASAAATTDAEADGASKPPAVPKP